jgi:hypothetical protein
MDEAAIVLVAGAHVGIDMPGILAHDGSIGCRRHAGQWRAGDKDLNATGLCSHPRSKLRVIY